MTRPGASAVRYDKDADGIVTLTLDDPTASANTMNDALPATAMHGDGRRRLVADEGRASPAWSSRQRQEDLLRRRRPRRDDPGEARGRRRGVRRRSSAIKADLRRLETLGQAGRRRDQRRRARRRPRDRAGLPPPDRRRRPQGRGRPARGHARPAARRRRRHPGHPDARASSRADGRAAPGHRASSRPEGRSRSASSTSWSPTARTMLARRRDLDRRQPGRRSSPGTAEATGCPAARPVDPTLAAFLPAFPALPAQADQGRATTRPSARSCPPPSRARRSTSTPRSRIESRYLTEPDRRAGLEEHDPGVLLRPAGDQRRHARARTGIAKYSAAKVGVLGAGMMGAGIAYSCARAGMRGRAQGRLARGRRAGQGLLREAPRQGHRAREATTQEKARGAARPDHPDRRPGRPGGLRPGHRGGLRGPEPEAPGVRRGRCRT